MNAHPREPVLASSGWPGHVEFTAPWPEGVRQAARWYATADTSAVRIAVRACDVWRESVDDPDGRRAWEPWADRAACRDQVEEGVLHARTLRSRGYDPFTLAAVRGTRLPSDLRLLMATARLEPQDALALARNPDRLALRTLLALRCGQPAA